jgi:copper transport protein
VRVATLLVLAAAFMAVLTVAAPAVAHSELVRSDPPDGGKVAVGRSELSLWYAQAIDPRASRFLLHTVDGEPVDVVVSTAEDGFLRLEVPALQHGSYVLDWHVSSREDGHVTSGSLLFGVGVRPDAVSPVVSPLPGWPTLLVRWLDLGALLVALGAVAMSGRVLARSAAIVPGARARAVALGAVAAGVGLAASVVTPFLRNPDAVRASLTDTPWGRLWLLQVFAFAVAAVVLGLLAVRRTGSWQRPVAAIALVVVAAADAKAGHSSELPHDSATAVAATTVHVVASGIWAGGLGVLVLCLVPVMRRDPAARRALLGGSWRAFSPLAAVSSVLLLASGLYLAGRQVPDLHAVSTTLYGAAVAGKTLAVVVVLAVAASTTLLVNPRLSAAVARRAGRPRGWLPVPHGRFARLVDAELAVLAVAVVLAAVLTSVPTARDRALASGVAAPQTATVDGLFLTFEGVPAGAGESRIIVRVSPVTRPQPGPVTGSDVLLVAPDQTSTSVVLHRIEEGRFEGTAPTPSPGAWKAWVAVQRPSAPDAIAEVGWTVAAEQAATPLERVTTTAAWLIVAGLAGLGLGLVLRRRRAGDPPPIEARAAVGVRGRP